MRNSTLLAIADHVRKICLLSIIGISSASAVSPTDWQARVDARLLNLFEAAAPSGSSGAPVHKVPSQAHLDSSGRVEIDVHFDCARDAPTPALSAAGLSVRTSVRVPPYCVVEGWAAPAALPNLASVSGVKLVNLPIYSHHSVPKTRAEASPLKSQGTGTRGTPQAVSQDSIDGDAINIMHSDVYAQQTGSNGAGITVAVFSDDVTNIATIQARGELPGDITIYPGGYPQNPTDEGTMMLEEVYAVAPGAALAFCGAQTEAQYVSCLQAATSAYVNIIADDLAYAPDDLMSSTSPFAQAVQTILSASPRTTLFSAAGNNNGAYWEGPYHPIGAFHLNVLGALQCTGNGQVDTLVQLFPPPYNTLTLTEDLWNALFLEWADQWGKNVSNFDLYVLGPSFNVISCRSNSGFNPLDEFYAPPSVPPMPTLPAGTYYLAIGTPDDSFSGKYLKLDAYTDGVGSLSVATPGSVDSPQKFVSGVQTIGAVDGSDGIGNRIEPFSAIGPIHLEFPTPIDLQAPIFVAPDNVSVDNIGTLFPAGVLATASSSFQGTSAATPNAAAVLALLESSFQDIPATTLLTAMRNGAAQLGTPLPNGTFGYGRVDAVGALNATTPAISTIGAVTIVGGRSSGPLGFTLTGVGTLTVTADSDNPSLVSFGATSDVSLTNGCGTTTYACSMVITPPIGQTGTAHITLRATDGVQRAASTTFTVTVTKPARPIVTVTAGAGQTITEGGTASGVTFTMSGTGQLSVSATSSNNSLLQNSWITLTKRCGSTAALDTCVATLTTASGQTGTTTITITAQDQYGQTGSGTATLQVNASQQGSSGSAGSGGSTGSGSSGGGGGGSLDLWTLLALGSVIKLALRPRGAISRMPIICGARRRP